MEQDVQGGNKLYLTYSDPWDWITSLFQHFDENFVVLAWWPILPHNTKNQFFSWLYLKPENYYCPCLTIHP